MLKIFESKSAKRNAKELQSNSNGTVAGLKIELQLNSLEVDLVEGVERLLGGVELGSDLLLRAPAWVELIDRLLVTGQRVVVVGRDLGEQSRNLDRDRRRVRELCGE